MAPTSEAPTATPGEGQIIPTAAPTGMPITPMPAPTTPVPAALPLPPIAPTEAPAVPTPVPTVPALPTAPPTPVVPTEMPTAVLPSLIGLGEDQAKGALAALGITQVVVDYQGRDRLGDLHDSVPAYAVVSHSPPAGAPTGPGTQVVLGVRAP